MRDLIRSIRARRRSRMVARTACCLGVGTDMAVCCSRGSFSSRAQPTSVYSRVGDELLQCKKFFARILRAKSHSPMSRQGGRPGVHGDRPHQQTLVSLFP